MQAQKLRTALSLRLQQQCSKGSSCSIRDSIEGAINGLLAQLESSWGAGLNKESLPLSENKI